MAKKTLYQALQVSRTAEPEVIKAAYEAKLAVLKGSAAPEVAAERVIAREAYELLADPVRRRLYDEKLREEHFRALSSGGEDTGGLRPANIFASRTAESAAGSPLAWMSGIALLVAVSVIGTWVWLDHKRKTEAQRLELVRQSEEARLKDDRARLQRETVDWAKDRSDGARQTAEQRHQDAVRQSERRQTHYESQHQAQQDLAAQRRLEADRRQAEYQQQRLEQENVRRAQQQLERDRRHLQELERNRGMNIPAR